MVPSLPVQKSFSGFPPEVVSVLLTSAIPFLLLKAMAERQIPRNFAEIPGKAACREAPG
jgi:hypothetical protein